MLLRLVHLGTFTVQPKDTTCKYEVKFFYATSVPFVNHNKFMFFFNEICTIATHTCTSICVVHFICKVAFNRAA